MINHVWGHQCSETTLTGESWFHISTPPLGIEPGSHITGSKRVVHWTSETWYECSEIAASPQSGIKLFKIKAPHLSAYLFSINIFSRELIFLNRLEHFLNFRQKETGNHDSNDKNISLIFLSLWCIWFLDVSHAVESDTVTQLKPPVILLRRRRVKSWQCLTYMKRT